MLYVLQQCHYFRLQMIQIFGPILCKTIEVFQQLRICVAGCI